MRTIIAGSRGDPHPMAHVILATSYAKDAGIVPTVVISGTARGVDQAGEQWADLRDLQIERYPAQWELHGRLAGKARNVKMAERAQALIAVWDGKSPGTKHMIDVATRMGLRVFVYRTDLVVA